MRGKRRRKKLTHCPELGQKGLPQAAPDLRKARAGGGRRRGHVPPPAKSGLCDLLTQSGAGKTAETPSPRCEPR